jgi:anthranilate phosphoribosyltransferase
VAKHGNRSASGNSGSAEVLAELGVAVEAEPSVLRRCLDQVGITFLFAPRFHPALRVAAPVRKQLPFRTLFNLIGPLANPARPDCQLIGVPGHPQAELIAGALIAIGIRRAAVVTGADGLDEVTPWGPTHVRWVESGQVRPMVWTPDDFGLGPASAADLSVSGPAESADRLRRLFAGEPGPVREVVLANSAAALFVAGRVDSLRDGVALAAGAIDAGEAARRLGDWVKVSRGD